MSGDILAINAGSSTLKFALFETGSGNTLALVAKGEIEGIGTAPQFHAKGATGEAFRDADLPAGANAGYEDFLAALFSWLEANRSKGELAAVGHRIVHGGPAFHGPVFADDRVLADLDRLVPLAPLHQPHNLAAIRALRRLRPGLPQVACFDTAFHHGMAPLVTRFALPRQMEANGVRRYGFHGLSYEFIAGALPSIAPDVAHGRVIVAHLGNGASLCALHAGRSVDTTMGFTALDGLPMGTRCGALDPGVILYLVVI